jgi:hypothetical protein
MNKRMNKLVPRAFASSANRDAMKPKQIDKRVESPSALPSSDHKSHALERTFIDGSFARDSTTGVLICVRIKFKEIPPPQGVSRQQFVFPVRFYSGGTGTPSNVAIVSNFAPRIGLWTFARGISTADVMRRFSSPVKQVQDAITELTRENKPIYEVSVGMGEQIPANADEVFLFAVQSPAMTAIKDEAEKSNWLSKWVCDLIMRERKERQAEVQAEAKARNEPKLKEFPACLPHESPEMDHYKNRQDVLWMLLGKTWPRLFKVMDKLQSAKTEPERTECQNQAMLAYIADHKAIYGIHPEVRTNEAGELWRSDDFVRMMSDALNAPKARVDKIDWQLADGWIEKNYYRMSEKELEEAFVRDWNYKRGQHKGNTLAKRAHRKLGLQSALPPGRRPDHKFDDAALKMRT